MRRNVFLLAIGLALSSPAFSAKPNEIASFKPSSQWAIDYADESCRLIRNFSDGRQDITLAFERFVPGPGLRLGISAPALRIATWEETIKFRYGPGGKEQEGTLLQTELADGRKSFLVRQAGFLYAIEPPQTPPSGYSWSTEEELGAARKIDSLTLSGKHGDGLVVDLGAMEAPLKALQACTADLMHGWGLDMNRMLGATRLAEPVNEPAKWIVSDDYPREMLAHGRTGVVGFRLIVDEQGAVKRCFVDVDKPGPFEVATCEAVKRRARFTPALDADGKPMPALYSCSVRYVL